MKQIKKIHRLALGEVRLHASLFWLVNIVLGIGAVSYAVFSSLSDRVRDFSYALTSDSGSAAAKMYFVSFQERWFEPSAVGAAVLLIGALIGCIAASEVFRDTESLPHSDMMLSLPMSGTARYFSKLTALFYIHILPVIVWTGAACAVGKLRCALAASREDMVVYDSFINGRLFLAVLATILFIDAITVLFSTFCGAISGRKGLVAIAVIALSAAPMIFWNKLEFLWTGRTAGSGIGNAPFGWTLAFLWIVFDESGWELWSDWLLVLNCLISVTILLLCVFPYRRRDGRDTGKPVISRVFYECIFFGCLAFIYGASLFRVPAYWGIIIGLVIFLLLHLLVEKGQLALRKMPRWIAQFVIFTVIYLLVAFAAFKTGGFGGVKKLPEKPADEHNITLLWVHPEAYGMYGEYMWTVSYERSLTDPEARTLLEIVQKYMDRRERTADEFFRRLLHGEEWVESYRKDLKQEEYKTSGNSDGRQVFFTADAGGYNRHESSGSVEDVYRLTQEALLEGNEFDVMMSEIERTLDSFGLKSSFSVIETTVR